MKWRFEFAYATSYRNTEQHTTSQLSHHGNVIDAEWTYQTDGMFTTESIQSNCTSVLKSVQLLILTQSKIHLTNYLFYKRRSRPCFDVIYL